MGKIVRTFHTVILALALSLIGLLRGNALPDSTSSPTASETELLPILSYDTDTGLGYGCKVFFLNRIGWNESVDVVLFNSTKGERWYHVVFSIPDFERRQGTPYPIALDLTIDYDKWIKNSFFGIGNTSSFADREFYTKEPIECTCMLGRGFTNTFVGQGGLKYRAVRNFGFSPNSRLAITEPPLNVSRVSYASLLLSARYDTRNSFVNPTSGLVLQGDIERAPDVTFNDVAFSRASLWIQHYSTIRDPATVLALRLGMQALSGDNLPVQILVPIGGTGTLRGLPQDRYLDRTAAVFNAELRIPLYWRFGAVVGADAGKVWESISKMDFRNWATNPVAGLRFFMDTFVVRLDVGVGKETTGVYLNFGQLF